MEIIKFLSLQNLDLDWQNTAVQSKLVACLKKYIVPFISQLQHWSKASTVGLFLEKVSFYLTVLLFACLPVPQFARDKEGLAAILIAAFFAWLAGVLLSGKCSYSASFVDALVILFFAINIIATFSSHYFSYSLHGLLKLLVYILAYFVFRAQLANNPQRQLIVICTLLTTGILVSLYGLYQYKIGVGPLATWEDPGIENQATRIYATFNNPNLLAGYLLPLIMLAASLVFACWSKGKVVLSLLPAAVSCLLTLSLILTGSRGAYLGAGAGFLALVVSGGSFLWQHNKQRRFALVLLVLLILVTAAIAFQHLPGFEQRIFSIFAGREHSSNSFRLNVWHSSLAMFRDNWLIGVGVGNQAFSQAYGLYMRSGFDALATYCVPLEIAVETGIFGLLCFTIIAVSALCRAHMAFYHGNLAALNKWVTCGAAAALFALLAHGLVDTVFFRPQVHFIFFLLLSMLAGRQISKNAF